MSKARKVGLGLLALLCALMLGFGLASCGSKDETPAYGYGEEGTYYYDDASGEEYLLTLRGGTYVLTYGTTGWSGSYSYDAGEDAFAFTSGGEDTFAAATADGALSVRYGGRTYLFLRYEYFTVTFTDGDETLSTQSVLNGKAATDPGAIEREGYVFYGWYQDAGFTKAFDFSSAVTADATAWGRYLPEGGDGEFIVTYDLTGETTGTVNGVVYDLPEPEMSGYVFLGWWVSATNSADELTYRYDGEQLYEDTTLFAVWAEEGASYLGASAYGDKVTWLASVGSTTEMAVYDAYGALLETRTAQSSSGSLSYDFSSLPAGRYTVEVTSGGVTETLTYVVKGLYRVSGYEVLPGSLFTYSPVENAERYYISVGCATEGHDHSYIDNGTSLFFDFSDCEMGPDGITFTVIAYAEGYYYSSSSYTYFLGLDRASVRVEGDSVLWDRVPYAMEYEVYVDGTLVCVTEGTSFSLKGYGPGTLEIEVRPVTRGYWSERSETYTYDKTTLAAPEISGVEGYEVTWTPVEGAAGYTVRIGGVETTVEAGITSLYLSGDNYTEGLDSYEIAVKALAADSENDSPYGDAVVVTGADVGSAVSYENGTVTWQYSLSAAEYRIAVNDGDETVVTGTNSSPVTLTKSGNNEIRIYFVNDYNEIYGTASVTVYAYAIVFDARGGTAYMGGEPVDVIYVAKGDTVTLPTAEYSGILADFVGWYTLPDTENTPDADGYLGDGYLFEDGTVFTGSSTMVLYACWINQRIKVSLNAGSGTLTDGDGNAIEYVEIPVDSSSFTIAVPETYDKAYAFYGWYTGAGGTGSRYTYEDGTASTTFRSGSATTLYAYWAEILSFSTATYDGETVLSVSKGADIGLFSEITIPDTYTYEGEEWTVTYMDPNGFQSCSSLKTLNIPDTVVYMNIVNNGYDSGNGAFASTALENVNVYATGEPSTTREIVYYSEDGVLFWMNSATGRVELLYYPYGRTDETYEIPATVSNETEYELQGNTEVPVVRDVTALSTNVFRSHTELTYMIIPDTVKDLGTYTFYGCTNLAYIEIPDGLETIGDYTFYNCSSLTSFEMSDNVTELGQYAFYGCSSLLNVTLSNSLTAINNRTFYNCSSLRGMEIPYGVTTIGDYVFYGCSSLAALEIPYGVETIGNYFCQNCTSLTSIVIPDSVTSLGTYAFQGCTSLKSATLSASLTKISDRTFYNCNVLASIVIPEGVTTIGQYAFAYCYMLADVYLPTTLESTSSYAFEYCYSLTNITLPEGMTSIGSSSFYYCYKLVEIYNMSSFSLTMGSSGNGYVAYYAKNVYTPTEGETHISDIDGFKVIYDASGDYYLFRYDGTSTDLDLPEDVYGNSYAVMAYSFYGNNDIKSVTIPEAVTTIGSSAFYNCYALEEIRYNGNIEDYTAVNNLFYKAGTEGPGITVYIGANVKSVPAYFFDAGSTSNAPKITKVVFEDGSVCEAIGGYAFAYCQYIEEIVLPGTVKTIGTYAFYSCSSITSLVIPDSVTEIGTYSFYGLSSMKTLQLSSSLTEIPNYAFYNCYALGSVIIPEGVTRIGNYAFYQNYDLKYVTLPSTLVEIGQYAFAYDRSIVSIVLPENLETIGNYAFRYCYKLAEIYNMSPYLDISIDGTSDYGYITSNAKNVYTPESGNTHLISIEGYLFIYDASDNYYLMDYEGDDTELVLPGEADGNPYKINSYAFYGNDEITSVVISEGVKSIGDYAFYDCTNLEEIYFLAEDMEDLASGNNIFTYAGQGTDGITVYIGAGVTRIPDYLFYSSTTASYAPYITAVVFEEGSQCEEIGAYAFRGLSSLTRVVIPSSVKTIGDYAFYDCTSLTSVTLSEGLESIGAYAFRGCTSLRSLTIPSTVETIGNYAFYNCTSLSTLTLLNGIKTIGGYAFANCTSVKSVTIPSSVTMISQYAFNGCSSLVNISILGKSTLIAEEVFTGTGFYDDDSNWSDGSLYIGNYLIKLDADKIIGSYTIPDGIVGIAGRAFYNCANLTKVTIPDTVTTLGDYIFYGCSSLTDVKIPDSVVSIGNQAFAYCTSLTELVIPDSVTYIGSNAFYQCESLREMVIPRGITELNDYLFYGCTSLVFVDIPAGVTTIGSYVFYNCKSLTRIDLPENVTSIGNYAFAYCTSITEMTIPDGVKTLSSDLFYDCTNLVSVSFASDITSIGSYAFWECESLKVALIPETVTSIGTYAYYGCLALEEIYFNAAALPDLSSTAYLFGRAGMNADACVVYVGASVTRIPDYLFRGSASPYITSIVFADGSVCEYIGDYAFYQCTELVSINMPSTVTHIGDRAFYGCTTLPYVDIPAGVTYIGDYAFYNCQVIDGIVLPEGITAINSYTFQNCYRLSEIVIPESVTSIGSYAFYNCWSFTYITIPENVESIGNNAFTGCHKLAEVCNLSSLDIVAGSSSYGNVAANAINVYGAGEGSRITEIDGYLFIYDDEGTYYLLAHEGDETDLVLPEYVNGNLYEIYQYAFEYTSITSVVIPETVSVIGEYAFLECHDLVRVILPDTVKTLPVCVFDECTSLETIVMDGVTYIDNNAFYGCTALTGFVISDAVTYIGEYAFYGCTSMKTLTIGRNVETIGNRAFQNCTALEEVRFNAMAMDNLSNASNYVFAYAGTAGDGISVIVGANVTYLPNYLFCPNTSSTYACKVVSVTFEEGSVCESIGTNCFYNCFYLTELVLPDSLKEIGGSAFYNGYSLISVTIPENVTSIGSSAFYYCYKLVEVYDKSSLSITAGNSGNGYVGYYAKNVYTPKSGESHLYETDGYIFIYDDGGSWYLMGYEGAVSVLATPTTEFSYEVYQYAFYGRNDITEVTLSESVTNVGEYAFYECINAVTVTIGDNVASIGTYAFYGCTGMKTLTIGARVTGLGNRAFYNTTSLETLYYNATAMNNLSSSNYVFYCSGQDAESFVVYIGANVTKIPSYLFDPYNSTSYVPYITEVVFAEGSVCESIGQYAFGYDRYLETIHIPDSVTSIGTYAFYNCTSLKDVTLSENLTELGNYTFASCSSLPFIIIPDSVTTLGTNVFYSCSSLTGIVIGSGVTEIGNSSFNSSALVNVYYKGDAAGWNAISIGSTSNSGLTNATMYYYSEEEPDFSYAYNYWHYVDGEVVVWEKG